MTPGQLTQTHRAQQLLIRRATVAQVAQLWPALRWDRLDDTYPDLAVRAAKLVQTNRQTSSGVASQYLRAFRAANGVPGSARIVLAAPLNVDQFAATLRINSVVALKNAAAVGTAADVAMGNALTLTGAALSGLVLDAGRDTVTRTSVADPKARGWQRIGAGGCDFCSLLLGRGAVYSEASADFEAHAGCRCGAEPVFD